MKQALLYLVSVMSFVTFFAACGDKGGGSSNPNQVVTTAQMCSTQPGYVQTQYGCVPQCPNNPMMGIYNGQCIPVTTTNTNSCAVGQVSTSYGCVSQCPNNPMMGYVNGQCVQANSNNFYNSMYGNNGMMYNNGMYYNNYNTMYYQQPYSNPYYNPYYQSPGFYFRIGW